MACERLKILSFPGGTYALSADAATPPCRYTVRWCPTVGHVVTLVKDARAEIALKAVREHHVLGDTINHLMEISLN